MIADQCEVHTYQGSSLIQFITDDENRLTVTIDTERLILRSIDSNEVNYANYTALFGDPEVMCKFATGERSRKVSIRDEFVRYL